MDIGKEQGFSFGRGKRADRGVKLRRIEVCDDLFMDVQPVVGQVLALDVVKEKVAGPADRRLMMSTAR